MRLTRTKFAVLAATALIASTVIGINISASGDDGDTPPEPAVPGIPLDGGEPLTESGAAAELITTSGSSFDPTILTKSIPARGFIATGADAIMKASGGCVYPSPSSGGSSTTMEAPVELPDGARIKRITLFGQDTHVNNIFVSLKRAETRVPFIGTPTNSGGTVVSFTTLGSNGVLAVSSADNLNEVTGSFAGGGILASHINHRFHYVSISTVNSAGVDNQVCGVEVQYQVPVSSADTGSVFNPLTGYRAYDSRSEMAPIADGPITTGDSRIIPVKDGRDIETGAINLPNAIPTTATAVTYTVTAADPTSSGFLFVGPGNATEITASSVNWDNNTSGAIANSGTVQLDTNRQIKVFAGGPGSSTQFIIDITGYYAPTQHPNMAN
jgi:hypothetical protein